MVGQRGFQKGRKGEKAKAVCWIPGHSGIPGNEEANRAADRGRTTPLLFDNVPVKDIIRGMSQLFYDSFQRFWETHRPTFLQRAKTTVEKWNDRQDRLEHGVELGTQN